MKALLVVVVAAALLGAVVASEVDLEVDVDAEGGRPSKAGSKLVRPMVDMKLLRSSPNVVIVKKGDPRARPPVTPATERPTFQKAPRVPKKPPTSPASQPPAGQPSTGPAINVGSAAPMLKAAAPAYSSAACTAQRGSCTTSCPNGNVVRGICPGPASVTCCVPRASQTCLSNFNAATFAARALAYQQAYRSHGVVYGQSSRQFGASPPVRYADCTSFITSVLDSLGWNCLFAAGRYTGYMNPIMQSRGGFHSTPKTGDLVAWSGHSGIVVQVCAGGAVRMVAMGTHGCADTGCIALSRLPGWGAGTFLGFWTPQ